MYLSKIELDIRHPSVRQALTDCHDMHRNVQKWFGSARAENKVLYRLYSGRDKLSLYVFSEKRPENVESGGSLIACKDMTWLEDDFNPGRSYCFDLLAAPSKKVSGEGKNSRRRAIRDSQGLLEWLERKGEQSGFEILGVQISPGGAVYGRRNGDKIIFDSVHYSGMLRVDDKEKFIHAWKNGIGPEKAYGMGLMMLLER